MDAHKLKTAQLRCDDIFNTLSQAQMFNDKGKPRKTAAEVNRAIKLMRLTIKTLQSAKPAAKK